MKEPELRLEAFNDNEIQAALAELFLIEGFIEGMQRFLPPSLFQQMMDQKDQVETILDFQRKIIHPFLQFIEDVSIQKLSSSGLEQLIPEEKYLFISNHRDIVLDSAFLNMILLQNGFSTCQIAIGDNLMQYRLSELLFRINKSFVVKREGAPRELYAYSKRLSEYIYELISKHKDAAWIAQGGGRSKDGNDRTQVGVLKMLSLSKVDDIKTHFQSLKIVPVSISYEIDPCCLLKTREHLRKQADASYQKGFQDDVDYIYQGLKGEKGHVHIAFGSVLNKDLETLDEIASDKQKLLHIAHHIDKVIHQTYLLHPINYVAYDLVNQSKEKTAYYSPSEFEKHKQYFEDKIKKLKPEFQEKGRNYLLGIYANPLINSMQKVQSI